MNNTVLFASNLSGVWSNETLARIFGNSTTKTAPAPGNFQFIFSLIINITATILNAVVLFLFCKSSSVRKPFNFYLANLCSANLLFTSLNYAVTLINDFLTARYPPVLFCAFLRYLTFLSGAAINTSHFLIAMNRLWAVVWPESYRRSHRSSTAARRPVIICSAMWIYIMVWLLPGVVLDTITPRAQPDIRRCSTRMVNLPVFGPLSVFVLLNIPIDIVLLTYPFILFKQIVRGRGKSKTAPATAADSAYTRHSHRTRRFSVHTDGDTHENPPVVRAVCCDGAPRDKRRNANFLTLSFLILTVLGSLFPAQIFFTALAFGTYIPGMLEIVFILYSLSPILDPLICLLTVGSFRHAFRNHCC
ncbi:hypothetical protein RvY_12100 [Ramazzottius varieornatus]|uniref:G-protein coupled receptors family 1 profile domain-containing protein n=1 Tax=Ramazzottius varieornatus TaxID=947166 RepID=A0A1D1VI96_RAMVA|nr:hypothetical protein RvY_12100 [Ramazzottius varieornatus]